MSQLETEKGEWENPENWKLNELFYFSRKDTRSIVPKKYSDIGFTLNFAQPMSYAVIVSIMLIPGAVLYKLFIENTLMFLGVL